MNTYRLFVYQDIDNRWVWGIEIYDSINNNWVIAMNGTKKYKFLAKKMAKKKYSMLIKLENAKYVYFSDPLNLKWKKTNVLDKSK